MANELSTSLSFSYSRGNYAAFARSLASLGITVSSDPLVHDVLAVTTAEILLPLGGVTLGNNVMWGRNLDSSNFCELRTATGSTKIIRFKAGEAWLFRLSSGISAPYMIADTATVNFEYAVFSQ